MKKNIVVHVSNGIASVINLPKDTVVQILDFDNFGFTPNLGTTDNILCRHCNETSTIREWNVATIHVFGLNSYRLHEALNDPNSEDVEFTCPRCFEVSMTSQLEKISPRIDKEETLKSVEIIVQKTRTKNKRVLVRINNEIFYPGNPEGSFNFNMSGVHLVSMPALKRPRFFSLPLIDDAEGDLKRIAVIVDEDFDVSLQINNVSYGLNAGGGLIGFNHSYKKQGVHIKVHNELARSK
ncbi:hypothetical protein [Paenibacillus terrae]|uniref:Uncharacterized protein n=1 Tax=Paenibacillus terrae TaxID=159743 RepID=A0A0D7WY11_9BACL|nr:hypothetical protein [Paenibacillus terrae]KJD42632.1 hypothetical protein QD47_27160 [Paenibacillus terrae]